MIDTKELRIGNFVSTNCEPMNTISGGIYEVLIIDSREKFGKSSGYVTITTDDPIFNNAGTWCKNLEPIPLTPEILEKCGFKKSIGDSYLEKIDIYENDYITLSSNFNLLYETYEDGNEKWYYEKLDRKIQYVHELQNIYFALSGEELEVKL